MNNDRDALATLREILGAKQRHRHRALRPPEPGRVQKLSVSVAREGGAVVDLAAARAEKRGTLDHGVTTDAVDEGGAGGVSTDAR